MAEFLIEKGLSVTADETTVFLLGTAVQGGLVKMIDFLCVHGADIDEEDYDQNTALSLAISTGDPEIMGCVLAHGATIQESDYEQLQPFLGAIYGAEEDGNEKVEEDSDQEVEEDGEDEDCEYEVEQVEEDEDG
jgi:ankyrin repeat protein